MKQPLLHTLKSRLFAVLVHAAIWILLFLAAIGLTGKMPDVREEESFSVPPQDAVPVSKLGSIFNKEGLPKMSPGTNTSAFYTRYFVPPPVVTPPVPTTRKFELTYQGFYGGGGRPKYAIVKIPDAKSGDSFVVSPLGGKVISNVFVADASFQALVLTNTTAQTNILLLNVKKEIEVPIQ